MKVVLNPGHFPGKDSGAVGAFSNEADIVLAIAEKCQEFLQGAWVESEIVRANELEEITDAANATGADIFVSIHANSASNPEAHGTETFYSEGSTNGKLLANAIQSQIVNTFGLTDRGLKTDGLYVVRHTTMPAVLVETAFISNAEEEKLLNEHIDDFAAAIARGITDYQKAVDFTPAENENQPDAEEVPMQSKYFSTDELACHHCGELVVSQTLLDLLDELREAVGGPLYISCAYRCPFHNREVGGVDNSQHVLGTAADVLVPDGWTVDQLADLAVSLNADGVGRYYDSGFVHVDVREGRVGAGYAWSDQY